MEKGYGREVVGVNEASETERRRSLSGGSDASPAGQTRSGGGQPMDGGQQPAGGRPSPDAQVPEEPPAPSAEADEGLREPADPAGAPADDVAEPEEAFHLPRLIGLRPGRHLAKPVAPQASVRSLTPEQRLLLLDTWQKSGLPAADFGALVGISKHTLYWWRDKFNQHGPGGLMDPPRRTGGSGTLSELTRRTILMLKEAHPEYGCERISDMLVRGPALAASASTVAKVLHEAGYELQDVPTRPHPDKVRQFERARPGELWQSDLFTFILKRQNRRVYLVAFMDDHSRYVTGYGLHASQSTALVLEVLRAAIASHGTPQEILTDNGSQYVTWRGKSAFARELEKRGIRHVVASPRRPQTLGKVERFWGTLWRECLEAAVFLDMEEARLRIGLFIDHYNFQRPHQGIDGLVPADRFFQAAPEVLRTLKDRVKANALELARNGIPKAPFYLTGQVGGKPFSVHAEGEKVILTRAQGVRQEVALVAPPQEQAEQVLAEPDAARASSELPRPLCPDGSPAGTSEDPLPPGQSPLDEGLRRLSEMKRESNEEEGEESDEC